MLKNETDDKVQYFFCLFRESAIVFIGIIAENCPDAIKDDSI